MFFNSELLAEVEAELVAVVKVGAALVEVEVEGGLAATVKMGAGVEVALVEAEDGLAAAVFFA